MQQWCARFFVLKAGVADVFWFQAAERTARRQRVRAALPTVVKVPAAFSQLVNQRLSAVWAVDLDAHGLSKERCLWCLLLRREQNGVAERTPSVIDVLARDRATALARHCYVRQLITRTGIGANQHVAARRRHRRLRTGKGAASNGLKPEFPHGDSEYGNEHSHRQGDGEHSGFGFDEEFDRAPPLTGVFTPNRTR